MNRGLRGHTTCCLIAMCVHLCLTPGTEMTGMDEKEFMQRTQRDQLNHFWSDHLGECSRSHTFPGRG